MNDAHHSGLDRAKAALDHVDGAPVDQHVNALSLALDAIVTELDDLARTIPPAT